MDKPRLMELFRSNCVPKALWLVSGKPEICVLGVCLRYHFNESKGGGMFTYDWLAAATVLGLQFTLVPIRLDETKQASSWGTSRSRCHMTLGEFCRAYKTGVYLVGVHAHLLVVNNGAVMDLNYGAAHARRTVVSARRVENSALKPLRPSGVRLRNPLFRFVRQPYQAHPQRWRGTPSRIADTYSEAFKYVGADHMALLSDVLAHTKYIRRDFDWDVKHGNIEIIEEA